MTISLILSLPLPRSAFFIFCSEFRPKVKGESPGLSIGDVAKKLGEMWNSTNAEDKQPYEKKAAKLKEKYEKVKKIIHVVLLSFIKTELLITDGCVWVSTLVQYLAIPLLQDIAAYRAKGKTGGGAPAKAPAKVEKKDDDDDDEDEDDEEEEEDDDEDDDE